MSLIYCESFDVLSENFTETGWIATGSYNAVGLYFPAGRIGGKALRVTGPTWGDGTANKQIRATRPNAIVGTALLSPGECNVVVLRSASSPQLLVYYDGVSRFSLWGGSKSVLLGTSDPVYPPNLWRYIELKVSSFDGTTGSAVVRVDGATIIDVTGVDTDPAGTGTFDTFSLGGTADSTWDDLYICDMSGPCNNDFLGDVHVGALVPTGAGTYTEFTPSAGSNWENVAHYDGDTDYNASSMVGYKDSFVTAGLPGVGQVLGVQTTVIARKDDAGYRLLGALQISGGFETDESSRGLSNSFDYIRDTHDVNPATGIPYTVEEVNAMEIGYAVTG